MSSKNGIVHVWELPKSIYIDFEPHYRKKVLDILKELSSNKNWYSIGKMLYPDEKPRHAYDLVVSFVKRNGKASFKLIHQVSKFLILHGYEEFSLENMEKKINRISADNPANEIANPKLPFNFNNANGSRFLSAIFHDGGITRKLNPFYVNFDSQMRKTVKISAVEIFGNIKSRIDGKKQLTFPKIIGEVLFHGLKLPSGRKIYFDPCVPEFIMEANKKIRISFIKQAFDDEGTVGKGYIRLKLASISKPSKLLKDDKKLIESLDIRTTQIIKTEDYLTKNNEKHECHAFFITGRSNLLKYYLIIDFDIIKKSNKLRNLLNNYKQYQTARNQSLNFALKNMVRLKLSGKIINSKELKRKTGRSDSRTMWYLRELVKLGFVKVIKESRSQAIGKGPTLREFELTKEGSDRIKSANIFEYE